LVATGFSRWLHVGFRLLARFSVLLVLGFSLDRKLAEEILLACQTKAKAKAEKPG
jgi:hypothetical protein